MVSCSQRTKEREAKLRVIRLFLESQKKKYQFKIYQLKIKVRFEFCSIPLCDRNGDPPSKEEDCFAGEIGEYDSKEENRLSATVSGLKCQRWDVRKPHRPKTAPENAAHNFCSDHDGDAGGAWCYTTDPDVRWEYCPVEYNCQL